MATLLIAFIATICGGILFGLIDQAEQMSDMENEWAECEEYTACRAAEG